MEKKMKLMLFAVAMAVVVGASMNPVSAATLTEIETVKISNNDGKDFNVSVFPGKASYAGSGAHSEVKGLFGDGTVLDYRFFNEVADALNTDGYANGGGDFIKPATGATDDNDNRAKVWTSNDPGTDFSGGAVANFASATIVQGSPVNGTIDIASLKSGTVFMIWGGYRSSPKITLTMSGEGQPDLEVSIGINPKSNRTMWISSFEITDAEAYDTITYSLIHTDSSKMRYGNFMGVVLDGVEIPGVKVKSPKDDAQVEPGTIDLIWGNMAPNTGDFVYVDVLLGTAPESLAPVANVSGVADVNSITVGPLEAGVYYWRVDSYLDGKPGDVNYDLPDAPNVVEGRVYSFTSDIAPEITGMGDNMVTWSDSVVPVQLDPNVVDDGASLVGYVWTADPADGVVFSDTGDSTSEIKAPTVTITNVATANPTVVTLTLSVNDESNPDLVTDTMTIDVYDTACKATRLGKGVTQATDFSGNCVADLPDLAIMAMKWLTGNPLTAPVTK